MNLVETLKVEAIASISEGIKMCDAADGLSSFNSKGAELVIWRRTLPARFQTWLEGVEPSNLPEQRVLIRPRDVPSALKGIFNECSTPVGDMRNLLAGDIHGLVSRFANITQSEFVDVRLERINHNSCWKFHRDNVEARLLTTYCGPATEWVHPLDAENALLQQKNFNGPIEALQGNDVAIFKGSGAGSGSGIVHRSPPIEGTGCTRLLLCLNQRSEISPSPWPAGR